MNEKATLSEIDTHWSITDVFDGNYALDLMQKAEEEAYKDIQRRSR